MKYNDNKPLTDHKVNLTMTSRPIVRQSNGVGYTWHMAARNNAKPKKLIDRQRDGFRSNPNVFMGC